MLFLENVNYGLGKQTAATSQYLGPKNPIWLTELEEVREPKCLFLVRLLHLLNSVAMTVMLCQAFSSLSSSLRMNTDPLPAWMLNTLSMSVRRSIVYLHKTHRQRLACKLVHSCWVEMCCFPRATDTGYSHIDRASQVCLGRIDILCGGHSEEEKSTLLKGTQLSLYIYIYFYFFICTNKKNMS